MNTARLICIVGCLSIFSCNTSKILSSSSVKPYEVRDIQRFPTLSYIQLIEKGNRGVLNDSLSRKSEEIVANAFQPLKFQLHITQEFNTDNLKLENEIKKETEFLIGTVLKTKNINDLKITPTLDSLLENSGKRFGLISVVSGFTRVKGNYGGQVAKGIGLGILTLGTVYMTPIKSYSNTYMMIIDSQDNSIVFFRKSFLEKDPMDTDIIKRQIISIFDGYFWTSDYSQ